MANEQGVWSQSWATPVTANRDAAFGDYSATQDYKMNCKAMDN